MIGNIPVVKYLWLLLVIVWLGGRFLTKRVKQREDPAAWIGRLVFVVVIFEFLFNDRLAYGWLGREMVPRSQTLNGVAIAVTALGVGLAIWARIYLAGNWSGTVTLKEGHELIRRGPYARIRHPIYTGFALAIAGTALAIDQWRGVVAFVAVFVVHTFKALKEEAWLQKEFGPAFDEHRRHTGMFLPRLITRE